MSFLSYLHFTRSEKIAISVLLSLILVCGAVYHITLPPSEANGVNSSKENGNDEAFETFAANMKAVESAESEKREQDHRIYKAQYKKYTPQPKLKTGETIELNQADTTALKMIPGIGSGYANRIIKYRNLLGGYIAVAQLKEVWGMDEQLYESIAPYLELRATESKISKLRINQLPLENLLKHPYINYDQARIIVDIRQRKGSIESMQRLTFLDEFTDTDIRRLKPYLSFD